MSSLRFALSLLSLASFAACAPNTSGPAPTPTITLAPGTGTLRAEVGPARSSTGTVFCALFNAAAGFPGASPIVGGSLSAPASSGQNVLCEYRNLPAGDYAVSVFHDENGNQQLDLSLFGAPVEGFGATNNVLPPTSAPTFADNRARVDEGQTASVRVQLRY
ncbi:MAG: DUF2141 domain-containing protein [Myxococcales bacterium]|nr:DUF2141 domain-containing protein [Myxococcales bacterium]